MIARIFLIGLLAAAPLMAADDFYEQELRSGKADYQASRLPQAADEFRIAAFGLMQQPVLLQEALARLAVVQNALGQSSEMARTIDRFVDVEQRFAPYAKVQLESSVKSTFEQLLVKQVPRATLQAIPNLTQLVSSESRKIAAMPPEQRIAAYEAAARREPNNPEWAVALARESAARGANADVIRWGNRALELDAANNDVRVLLAHARSQRRECREALAIIEQVDPQQHPELYADQAVCFAEMARWKDAEAALANVPENLRSRADVRRAAQRIGENARTSKPSSSAPLRAVPQASSATSKTPPSADAIGASKKLIQAARYTDAERTLASALSMDPENRTLKLALLEAAVLARDWRSAAMQIPAVTPLKSGEELYMFYASVALYETGRLDEARLFMQKARPRMVSSPMVDYYLKAILGERRGS